MKHLLTHAASLTLGISALLNQETSAAPIFGDISFSGSYTINNPNLMLATAFTSFSGVTVSAGPTGDYTGLDGAIANWSPFSFDPFSGSIVPLWAIPSQPGTSFDVLTLNLVSESPISLHFTGSGVAHKAGQDDTEGDWTLNVFTLGTTFSFLSGFSATGSTSVPEPSAALLVVASCGALLVRRWREQ